jgi:nitric oxide reductase NorQ protein
MTKSLPGKIAALKEPTAQTAARMIEREPYYEPLGREIELFEAAYATQIPVLLKGPTGCGKTRFMEYMAWRLKRPLLTVSCHDDLTAADLIGRYLITNNETVWVDGPLAHAVRCGGICYLDEIVEARKDTTVVIHPLADDRRILPMEKHGELLHAPKEFLLAMSYNPGYQSVLKELKQSTRQRFVAIEFNYPSAALEKKIIIAETGDRARRCGPADTPGGDDAQPQRQRPRRRRLDTAARACRQADRKRHSGARRMHRRHRRRADRRSGHAARGQ